MSVHKLPPRDATQEWRHALTIDRDGPHATVANAVLFLLNDPVLQGMVAYDEFAFREVITRAPPLFIGGNAAPGPYPRLIENADVSAIQAYLQSHRARISFPVANQAVECASREIRVHPVRDYLDGLVWDGVERLPTFMTVAFGCPADVYHEQIGTKFLVAAVRRIRNPGCKFDSILILEGPQDIGKSLACRALFGDIWFSDTMPDITTREAPIAMQGKWGIELSEISAIIRKEIEEVKAFLSRSVDKYRPLYSKRDIEQPRQTVLIGTTNERDYLRDPSGNRRIWPAWCPKADWNWILDNRDHLWAEAVHRDEGGEDLWLNGDVRDVAREMQADRLPVDMWADRIRDVVEGQEFVRIPDILVEHLLPLDKCDRRAELRVAAELKRNGWESTTRRIDGKQVRGWAKG